MPATINGTTGFGGNLTGNVTGNVTGNLTGAANATEASAPVIKAGTTLDGRFSAITLHSGTIVAYNK